MRVTEIKSRKDLATVQKYNDAYYAGAFRGSEATPVDMNVATMLVDLLETGYAWIDQPVAGNWTRYDLCPGRHTKYGTNYVYVDNDQKLLRIAQSASEFYSR
jgi:cell wall assembly regulator SMI1